MEALRSCRVIPLVAPPGAGDADAWYEAACALEPRSLAQARYAYRRALEIEPAHARARVNLGRILHEAGDARGAAEEYRRAPGDALAAFNLGVALEDLCEIEGAREAYERAIALDPRAADARWNLARLLERRGERARALGEFLAWRRLAAARPVRAPRKGA